jgi:hypothetical protein
VIGGLLGISLNFFDGGDLFVNNLIGVGHDWYWT